MKKSLIFVLTVLYLPILANAQAETDNKFSKPEINLEFYTTYDSYFSDSKFDGSSFNLHLLRLDIQGDINNQLSYRFRPTFNKVFTPNSIEKLSKAVDYAYLTWKPSDVFSLKIGKQYVMLGGYEYGANAKDIRHFSEVNNTLVCYQLGLGAFLNLSPTQELVLQVANNRNNGDDAIYKYGLPSGIESSKMPLLGIVNWNGLFWDKAIELRYAVGVGSAAKNRNVYYLTAGNVINKGPVSAYFDVMYSKEGVDTQNRLTDLQANLPGAMNAQNVDYLSLIGKFQYSFTPKWRGFVKGVYETMSVYKDNNYFTSGLYATKWNAQACLEWMPFNNDFILFLLYSYNGVNLEEKALNLGANAPDVQRLALGLVYTIPILRK